MDIKTGCLAFPASYKRAKVIGTNIAVFRGKSCGEPRNVGKKILSLHQNQTTIDSEEQTAIVICVADNRDAILELPQMRENTFSGLSAAAPHRTLQLVLGGL